MGAAHICEQFKVTWLFPYFFSMLSDIVDCWRQLPLILELICRCILCQAQCELTLSIPYRFSGLEGGGRVPHLSQGYENFCVLDRLC